MVLGSEFAQLQDRLAVPLAQGKVQLVSISFDPAHDTPQELVSYLQRSRSRGTGWLAARPVDPDGLAQLKRSFGITVVPDGWGGYTHNAAIHVVDPQGRLIEIVDLAQAGLAGRTVLQNLGP
jgi:protein SCO1/2